MVDAETKTYQVTPDMAGMSGGRRALKILYLAAFWVALAIVLHFLWPSVSSGSLLVDVIGAVITGTIWSVLMVGFYKRGLNYKITVSDERITVVNPWFARSVQKNSVRTVLETKGNALHAPGVRISKYGRLGTFLWGCVWIPKSLPEYESIRDLALRWKRSAGG